jgi:hypothetical protein
MTMGCWLARERGISFSLPASRTPLSLYLSTSHTQRGRENKAKQIKALYNLSNKNQKKAT